MAQPKIVVRSHGRVPFVPRYNADIDEFLQAWIVSRTPFDLIDTVERLEDAILERGNSYFQRLPGRRGGTGYTVPPPAA